MSDIPDKDGDQIGGDKFVIGDITNNTKPIAMGKGATATVHIHPPDTRAKAHINLPPYNPNFTGRAEQLEHIAATFATDNGRLVVTQAISGLGGVGKTQIALAYAYRHRDQYDVNWMLAADSTAALDNSLRELGAVMGLPVADKDTRTARQMVLNQLGNGEKQVLLLYDNADAIKPRDLLPYLPSGGHLLITSRRDNSQWRGVAQTVTLGTFTPAEAMDFWRRRMDPLTPALSLRERAQSPLTPKGGRVREGGLAALAKALGYLPLAMEQAAALMMQQRMTPAAYLTAFREDYAKIKARESAPDRYHATVTTTWEMAFAQARLTEGAADLLNLCSFFAPDDIPLQVIQDGAALLPDELAAVMADEAWGVGDALTALQSYSLLTVTDGKLNMHRLVQLVARERMGVERAQEWIATAIRVLDDAYHYDKRDMSTWTQCGELLPHLITATDLAEKWGVRSEQIASLNNWIGIYLDDFGDYEAAYLFYKRALSIRQELLEHDPDDENLLKSTATSLNNMGYLLDSMGDYEGARPFYEEALAINKKAVGDDHPDTASSLNNMGYLLQAMGDYEGARPFYEEALAIRKKILGDDHPDTATSLNNMGYLLQAMGDYEGARPFYEEALAINKKALGDDHPTTGTSFWWMGVLAEKDGQLEEARAYYQRTNSIFTRVLGENHPNTKNVRGYLRSVEVALA